jgi:hypothetical protein
MLALLAFPAAAFADTSFATLLSQFEQEYQLPTGILWKVALAENGGKATGCASTSSACGMFQFITSTWLADTKALFGKPLDPSLRNDPTNSARAAAFELANIKTQIGPLITQANVNLSAGLYLGYFLGSGGARRLFSAYLQNPAQSACALLQSQCSANQSVMSGRSLAQLINWAAQKMQASGVPNIAGNFQDSNGVSYAYSYADLQSSNFLPANTVIPANPYGKDATVFPATVNSSVAPAGSTGVAAPVSSAAPATSVAQPTVSPSTASTATSGSACTPQYYCSNNTVYYQSNSCSTSTFQICQYGCQGTICAPPPLASSTSLSVNAQQVTSPLTTSGSGIGTTGTIGTAVFATSSTIGTAFSSLLTAGTSTIAQPQTGTQIGAQTSTSGISYATNSESSSFDSVTLTSNNSGGTYAAPISPISQILNELRSALNGLLAYLGSL